MNYKPLFFFCFCKSSVLLYSMNTDFWLKEHFVFPREGIAELNTRHGTLKELEQNVLTLAEKYHLDKNLFYFSSQEGTKCCQVTIKVWDRETYWGGLCEQLYDRPKIEVAIYKNNKNPSLYLISGRLNKIISPSAKAMHRLWIVWMLWIVYALMPQTRNC